MAKIDRWRIIGKPHLPLGRADLWADLGLKQRGLLVCLMLSGKELSREDIAQLLWPDTDPTRGRHSLRQALVGLRGALGDREACRLRSDGEYLGFDTDGLDIDLRAFGELEQEYDPSPELVVDLCRGQLFEGVDARSDAFTELLESWRSEFASRAVALIDKAMPAVDTAPDTSLEELHRLRKAYAAGIDIDKAPAGWKSVGKASYAAAPPTRSGWRALSIATLGLLAGAAILLTSFLVFPDFRRQLMDLVPRGTGDVPKIAVRPFTPISGDGSERQLAGGVTIGVTYALYSITEKELFVITAPQDAIGERDSGLPTEFASELGVRYVIHGTLERDDDTVRVFVSFYDAEVGADIWQDRFDSKFTEAFGLQDAITLRILQGLDIDLSTAERNRIQYLDDTEDLRAWLLAANGVRNLIQLEPESLEAALESYKRALQIDPDYISARRGLAWYALLDVRFGLAEDPEQSIREARQHLDVILRRRPDDGMSRALEGLMLMLENDWDAAIDAGRMASRLLPGSADSWAVLAHNYTFTGQPDLALDAIDRAMRLSPGHPNFYNWIKGRALRLKGEYEAAYEYLKTGMEDGTPSIVQLVELAAAYSGAGRRDEAMKIGLMIREIDPDFSASEWVLHPAVKDPEAQSMEFELLSKAGL